MSSVLHLCESPCYFSKGTVVKSSFTSDRIISDPTLSLKKRCFSLQLRRELQKVPWQGMLFNFLVSPNMFLIPLGKRCWQERLEEKWAVGLLAVVHRICTLKLCLFLMCVTTDINNIGKVSIALMQHHLDFVWLHQTLVTPGTDCAFRFTDFEHLSNLYCPLLFNLLW